MRSTMMSSNDGGMRECSSCWVPNWERRGERGGSHLPIARFRSRCTVSCCSSSDFCSNGSRHWVVSYVYHVCKSFYADTALPVSACVYSSPATIVHSANRNPLVYRCREYLVSEMAPVGASFPKS